MSGLIVIGAGPLIGRSVVERFAREGMPATVLARSESSLQLLVESVAASRPGVSVRGVAADAADEDSLRRGLDDAVRHHGVPDVVVYNAAHIRADRLGQLSANELADTLRVNVVGAATAAAHLLPQMLEAGGGSFLFTGGMPGVKADYASLSLGKAALRTLADIVRAEVAGRPVHVATVTVCDEVRPGTPYDPDLIAEVFAELHDEEPDAWRSEVLFGLSPA